MKRIAYYVFKVVNEDNPWLIPVEALMPDNFFWEVIKAISPILVIWLHE